MRLLLKFSFSLLLLGLAVLSVQAQDKPEQIRTESSEPVDMDNIFSRPVDDVVAKNILLEKRVLPYENIREADVFWQKKVWRVIDSREKMNLPFAYPEEPFAKILLDGALKGKLKAYQINEQDKFDQLLDTTEIASQISKVDTITKIDPETFEEKIQIVRNDINYANIKKFRMKEIWFFDKESSTMQVRILGIAPIIDELDDQGNFKYERPLFWVYYPDCREYLARHKAFNLSGNDASLNSWEDLLEMRFFSSYVIKESNVYDRRIEDYAQGVDALMEGEKIKSEIFNFEHDLWSY